MKKNRLQIEINDYPYPGNNAFVAVVFRGGYTVKHYLVNDTEEFEGNCSFFNVFFRYIELRSKMVGLHMDVQRATASISFGTKNSDVIEKLSGIFNILFDFEYSEEVFNHAKTATKEAFAQRYKDGGFRAKYKAYEFSDLHKRYSLKSLINDIEQMDYEMFCSCISTLVVPENIKVYIVGDYEKIELNRMVMPDLAKLPDHSIRLGGYALDGFLRQEAHVVNVARENYNVIIEAFDFFNANITNFTKLIIVEMMSNRVEQRSVDVWVDSLDASIIFSVDKLRKYKERLAITNVDAYEDAKKSVLQKYLAMLHNQPEQFAILAASLMTIGVYVDQYITFIGQCSYEMFQEIVEKADFKVTEAQIVLRKGV